MLELTATPTGRFVANLICMAGIASEQIATSDEIDEGDSKLDHNSAVVFEMSAERHRETHSSPLSWTTLCCAPKKQIYELVLDEENDELRVACRAACIFRAWRPLCSHSLRVPVVLLCRAIWQRASRMGTSGHSEPRTSCSASAA